ncbi:MAG: ABC transporter permease [Bacteroidales bacterium]|nr:ABC transporter permease [Bacteroidales bacterium]MBN2699126.1 ABC transporter permease [Bacteroidales bacterium]
MSRYLHDIVIAIESIMANQMRSILTALGIIFGVAAVITMLAIGRGAQQEILDQIKMVGVNNIMVTPIVEASGGSDGEENSNSSKEKKKFSPGLSLDDVAAIKEVLPTLKMVSPEIAVSSYVVKSGKRASAKLIGVTNDYFDIFNLQLSRGNFFNQHQEENGLPVCVIGSNIEDKFFSSEDPIGKYIKFDKVWLKVIGVIQKTDVTLTRFENIGVNVMNDNIYIPAKTMLMRFHNRSLVASRIKGGSTVSRVGPGISISIRTNQNTSNNYHQLDRIIVQVNESSELSPSTEVLSRLILRRHEDVKDFEITVPELLLKQEQRTKDIFNIVLGAIASISLLVGGIGIMNIMFASVMERIKEIGTRLAIGAQKRDIVIQFLAEAVLISVTGGIIGVIIGIIASWLITEFADILTIVSPVSVIIAFVVSASVGIIFGYSPAKRASEKDPIESLRYE